MLALSVDDIDLDNNVIHIRNTTTRDKDEHIILGPCTKTPEGERDLNITELTRPILEKAIKNRYPSKDNLLFCKSDGNPYTSSALNSCIKRICKKIGITCRVHNHKLRNNFNTRGVEVGIDYAVLKENAGHADIHETIDTYATLQQEFKLKEMQKYVDYIKQSLGDVVYEI